MQAASPGDPFVMNRIATFAGDTPQNGRNDRSSRELEGFCYGTNDLGSLSHLHFF
jgi:hypothetical protein